MDAVGKVDLVRDGHRVRDILTWDGSEDDMTAAPLFHSSSRAAPSHRGSELAGADGILSAPPSASSCILSIIVLFLDVLLLPVVVQRYWGFAIPSTVLNRIALI